MPESPTGKPAPKAVVRTLAGISRPGAGAPDEKLPAFGTEAFNRLAKERGAAWMASRNRDAVSLLAMWDLTDDEAILREAAEKFPGDPKVCLAMLGAVFEKEVHEAERKQWTDQLIAADPDNPVGYCYQARLAHDAGDLAGLIAALETALGEKGRIDFYMRERMMGAKEGLLASGVPLKEAYSLSVAGPLGKVSSNIAATDITGFFFKEMAAMKAAGQEMEFQEMAALGLRHAEQQRQMQSPSLIPSLMAYGLRARFLQDLHPETEIANTGRSVAEECAIAVHQYANMMEMLERATVVQDFLPTAPLEIQGQYADRMMLEGELAAIAFLLEERAKRQP